MDSLVNRSIDEIIEDLDTILMAIQRSDYLIQNVINPVTKAIYKEQLDEMLKGYKEICNDLKGRLEVEFSLEKKEGRPRNLNHYRLYKRLG